VGGTPDAEPISAALRLAAILLGGSRPRLLLIKMTKARNEDFTKINRY